MMVLLILGYPGWNAAVCKCKSLFRKDAPFQVKYRGPISTCCVIWNSSIIFTKTLPTSANKEQALSTSHMHFQGINGPRKCVRWKRVKVLSVCRALVQEGWFAAGEHCHISVWDFSGHEILSPHEICVCRQLRGLAVGRRESAVDLETALPYLH